MPEMYIRWNDLKALLDKEPSGYICKDDIAGLEMVSFNCKPPQNGDIVRNTNNNTYGILLHIHPDKNSASILEVTAKNEMFVNCPPLAALEKTGRHLYLEKLIMKAVKSGG